MEKQCFVYFVYFVSRPIFYSLLGPQTRFGHRLEGRYKKQAPLTKISYFKK